MASAPSNVTATAGGPSSIDLDWDPVDNALEYYVYRWHTSGVGKGDEQIATVSDPGYTDTGLPDGSKYFYVVTALDDSDFSESSPSSEVSATTILPDPTELTVDAIDNDSAALSWLNNSVNEDEVRSEYRYAGASTWTRSSTLSSGAESDTISGLDNGRDYEFSVEVWSDGDPPPANVSLSITDYREVNQ